MRPLLTVAPDSALGFRRVPGQNPPCELCRSRAGQFEPVIAGYPVGSERLLAERLQICGKCRDTWSEQWQLARDPDRWTLPDLPPLWRGRFVLYRLYDRAGRLLYIGRSVRVRKRIREHLRYQPWGDEIAVVTTMEYPSFTRLARAELEAIEVEGPRYNREAGRELSADRESHEVWRLAIDRLRRDGLTAVDISRASGLSAATIYRLSRPWARRVSTPAQREARRRWQARNRDRRNAYQREWRAAA